MTDAIFSKGDESIKVKYVDNGDGSYTPVVDMGAGDINLGNVDVLTMPVTHVVVDSGVTVGLTDTQLRATPVPVSASDSNSNIGYVGGHTTLCSTEITLAASGISYHANDIMVPAASGISEIPLVARLAGMSGYVVGIRATVDKKSVTPRFRVHMFNASNPTIAADGANWQDKYADNSKRIAFWDLPALSTAADTTNSDMSRTFDFSQRIPYVCTSGLTSIWVGLETLDAWVAANGQKITIKLNVEQN